MTDVEELAGLIREVGLDIDLNYKCRRRSADWDAIAAWVIEREAKLTAERDHYRVALDEVNEIKVHTASLNVEALQRTLTDAQGLLNEIGTGMQYEYGGRSYEKAIEAMSERIDEVLHG